MILSFYFTILIVLIQKNYCDEHKKYIVEPVNLQQALYAPWAHFHWIWLSNPNESQESLIQLLKDYQSYDIPVGAINVDSAWPDTYQNFLWNEKKFPNASYMVEYFHSQNVKVICWITSTINNDSTNFMEGKQKGYYLSDGRLIKWWRGHAALLDYSNPNAVNWWHKQMDALLDIGIDGWKCDGTDPYVWELIDSYGYKGHITEREYADYYYRDFFYYTKQKRGDSLIMARPIDNLDQKVFIKYSPNDVMFSGWVGDQTGNWDGLKVALTNIVHSAWNNYLNFGMDIGGYRIDNKFPLGREKNVFIRWFQLGAFLPLMENGGDGEHRPWIFGSDVVETYRLFVNIHMSLVPFFINAGTQCYYKNISVIKPMAKEEPFFPPSTFDYVLFDDLFVSPFIENSTNKSIKFPGNSDESWSYWFNNSKIYLGGTELKSFFCPFNEFPVFLKSGSIIPLQIENRLIKLGTSFSKDYLTLLINKPKLGKHTKQFHEYNSTGYEVTYILSENFIDLFISAHQKNKYIVVIDGLKIDFKNFYLKSSKGHQITESSEYDYFWNSLNNSIYKDIHQNRLYVKIIDDATQGLNIKLFN